MKQLLTLALAVVALAAFSDPAVAQQKDKQKNPAAGVEMKQESKTLPVKGCCQFGLMLYNSLSNTIKKVVVIPTNPQAIIGVYNGEDPDWTLTKSGNQYIIEPVAGFVPANPSEVLDLDFAIKVDPAKSPTTVTVRWLNSSGQVLKEELLKLECQGKGRVGEEDFDYDWFSMRNTIDGVSDKVLFSGAEPEECEDFEDIEKEEIASVCDFDAKPLMCTSTQNYLEIKLSSPPLLDKKYDWQVDDNGSHPYPGPDSVNYPLTEGPHSINVTLTITYLDSSGKPILDPDTGNPKTETCAKQVDICIPSADFTVGTRPHCDQSGQLLGYWVDITPQDQDCTYNGSSSIDHATLDTGNGLKQIASGPSGLPVYTYEYPKGTHTYNVILTVFDIWGCKHVSKTKEVHISSDCDPLFHIEYGLCPRDGTTAVNVKFVNDSQTFCTSKFDWNFGDPSSSSNQVSVKSSDTVSHVYTYDDSQQPKDYTVALTITDGPCAGTPVSPVKSISATFTLKPVAFTSKVVVCPDGETHFVGKTDGTLGLGVLGPISPCCEAKTLAVNKWNKWWNKSYGFTCYLKDGSYVFIATATETKPSSNPRVLVKRTCTQIRPFNVKRTCCDDFKVKGFKFKTAYGKDYRLKFEHKVVHPTFGSADTCFPILTMGSGRTRIVGKTKFKVKVMVWKNLNVFYYKKIRAKEISVEITDNLRGPGNAPSDSTVTCRTCVSPTPFSPGKQPEYDKSHAKSKSWPTTELGTNQGDHLMSVHYVKTKARAKTKNYPSAPEWDWTITVDKPIGNMCNDVKIIE